MGKNIKNRYNWKARQIITTEVDDSESSKIQVHITSKKKDSFDSSNPLVLPSKKRKTRVKKDASAVTKILSKTQRKRLEKIVERKKKKENRARLLESLSKVQAGPEMMSQLTSITAIQTKGLKRHFSEIEHGVNVSGKSRRSAELEDGTGTGVISVNSLAGSKKRRTLLESKLIHGDEERRDPNVVGFEESSDTDDESVEEDEGESEVSETECDVGVSEAPETGVETGQPCSIETTGENSCDGHDDKKDSQLYADEDKESEKSAAKCDKQNGTPCSTAKCSKSGDLAPKLVTLPSKPAVFVPVHRRPGIQAARIKLPVLAEEQAIMEAIAENCVVIIAGETGSGKTTQVPQFLYEAGYARDGKLIGVTEPRRVAAISMSKRIGEEMNLTSQEVSYLIRFEGNVTDKTRIKFMTDGVLLKEIQNDFLISRYSVVILDEAHERSVYTDILIGLLSRIVPLRNKRGNPLKLIIMSATLRLEDFTENPRLFRNTPPVIKVETRQFPVTIHFNKRTDSDYCAGAFRKAYKIHTQLPDGGILIFLTGQQEVNTVVRKLRKAFPLKNKTFGKSTKKTMSQDASEDELDLEKAIQQLRRGRKRRESEKTLPNINLDNYSVMPGDDTAVDLLMKDCDEFLESDDELDDETVPVGAAAQPLWVLPLYSILPGHEQAKVFEPPPNGCRLCVVATNVAETSLTIPNVKYVVDCGRWKSRVYDKVTGISSFSVEWCSKASANQRAGRAGRTGPGHCYRLYSSAVFNDSFELYTTPEIQRKPVDDLVLQMKSMNIHKVVNFPFPSAPDLMQIKVAEDRLRLLGALEPATDKNDAFCGKLTPLGQAISAFPVAPRYGKMLALSHQHELLPYTLCLVAALSVQEVLLEVPLGHGNPNLSSGALSKWGQIRRKWAGIGNSKLLGDPMVLLRAVGAAEFSGRSGDLVSFCTQNGLRHKAIVEIRKLRVQLTNEVSLNVPELELSVDPNMPPPTDMQSRLLRQVMLSGMVDQVARRVDPDELKEGEDKRKLKHAYRIPEMEEPVFMHSNSVLRKDLPEWVVYQEIYETNKMYMRGVTAVEPEWLPIFAPALCNISEPMMEPPPRYDTESDRLLCHVSSTFGRSAWPLPVMELDFPACLDRYKWFARFILDGSVCPKLAPFTKSLLSTPGTMVKTWANLQPRTDALLKTLVSKKVDSASKLKKIWGEDPPFLLEAYKKWLPESAHHKVSVLWPPL